MPLKSLLTKFTTKPPLPPQRFLAIEVAAETVKTAVWQVTDGLTRVVTIGDIKDWDGQETSLLAATDESLAKALESIDPEPNQAVLGLPDAWVTGTTINDDAKKLLKSLSQKLELKFIGFVVTSEAIIHQLKSQEGTPPTTILLSLTETEVAIQVVHLGKILGSELVGRSQDLGADVEEGLARMKLTEPLPARMILIDGHLDLETARQTLLSYDWPGRLNFLHIPKIDILEREFSIRAVAHAGGTEAAKSLGFEVDTPAPEVLPPAPGFTNQADILTQPETPPPPLPPPPSPPNPPPTPNFKAKLGQLIARIKAWSWPRIDKPQLPASPVWLGAVAGFLLVITGLVVAYWNLPRAQVTIWLKAQTSEQELTLTAVPTDTLSIEVTGTLDKEATGEALVGDKAQGKVTLYNKTSQSKTFAKSTLITGPKQLNFSLDEEVTVASQSATSEGITFGKAEAAVVASQIGTESNLEANTEFAVANFSASSFSARNQAAFTGGSAQTATVVAKADHQELLDQLKTKLLAEAKDKLKSQLDPTETVLEGALSEEVIKQQFSKAVGEVADKVNLALQLKLGLLKVKQADLELVLLTQLQGTIPDKFKLDPQATTLSIKDTHTAPDGTVTITATVKAALVPDLNQQEIREAIKGKYPEIIRSYFEALPNYHRVEIELTPNLPQRLATLPRQADRITIDIKVEP